MGRFIAKKKRRVCMTNINPGMSLLVAALFAGSAALGSAQSLMSDGSSQEARNAYQEACFIQRGPVPQGCQLPSLPEGKRLAIRWLTARCDSGTGRVEHLTLTKRLFNTQSNAAFFDGIPFRPVSLVSSNGGGDQMVSEPVYAYSDTAPFISISSSTTFDSQCRVELRGFLVE